LDVVMLYPGAQLGFMQAYLLLALANNSFYINLQQIVFSRPLIFTLSKRSDC